MTNSNYYPINILTDKGFVELMNINPGDKIIEYRTNRLINVVKVYQPKESLIYKITYNDGRFIFMREQDYIYTGSSFRPVTSFNKYSIEPLKQYPINFKNKIINMLDPDPYVMGVFLMYGDYDDEYINLPINMTGINDVLKNKYSIEYSTKYMDISNNKAYFKYINKTKDTRIKWKDFLGKQKNYITTKDMNLPIIPDEYAYSSLKDRIQFIRGVFDASYSLNAFESNTIGIIGNEYRLNKFQKMLWSVGILSKIEYNSLGKENDCKLIIIGKYDSYPGFTYMIDHIEYYLDEDNKIIKYNHPFNISIDNISTYNRNGKPYEYGYMGNIKLEKMCSLYITDNFLPRASV